MRFMLPRSLREAAQSMMLSFFTCWVCAVAITRLYAFHSSYMKHLTKIEVTRLRPWRARGGAAC